jgi:amino acid adenylation domain-containing protein
MSTKPDSPPTLSGEDLRDLLADRLRQAADLNRSNPLSFAQQRLWFLDQLEPNTPLYNIPCVARMTGTLDVPALEQSLNAIVARHETFRTRFVSTNGEPGQVIDEDATIELQQRDLTGVDESEREAEMERMLREEVRRPFNLGTDQLLRATLLRLQPDEHVIILNMHHIISDEWSLKVMFRELAAFYKALVEGKPVSLSELPIQYGDYAVWQREWLAGELYEKQLSFWKEQLRGNPSAVELPTDHPRNSNPTSRGACQGRELGQELGQALKELAQREGVTLFMVLLAAFKTLLYRYTQQEDIIVGSPLAGRTRMETENLIGFFVNTVPLRTRISGDPTFLELLAQVREVALGAYSHQDLPFEKLVQELHPERLLNQTPFIKVMFLTQSDMAGMRFPGMLVKFMNIATGTAKFDLSLGVEETDEGLLAGMEYKTDLFEPATITRMLQQFESLLQGIVAQPTQHLSELPLLSEAERRQLLVEWSPPVTNSARGQCLHQWFEAQVERAPEATALSYERQSLTYRELNAQANQLAHHLKRLGVGPEVPVALHLERSFKMVVAILAVLKAGGAYVPMDPAYPQERLSFMLEDTQAPVLLSLERLRAGLPAHAATVVCLDSDWETIAAESAENPASSATDENPAYIIYTSGSTGKPKGVLITHYNVVRLFRQTEHWYGFDSNDVWTLFHSYTFDFSVWELWGALLYGGRLVVVPFLVSRSPGEFYELLAQEKVTVLNQTPSAFRQLLWAEATAPVQLALNLRYVIFGGEALELQSLKPWFDRHGDERPLLVNMYGITETTVHVTYRPVRQVDLNSGVGSVIGVPIPDLKVYLLDEKLQPVPQGLPGEICVAGAGVARGYLNRPELTSQRFLSDPFTSSPGVRLYRSGDLARYSAQGELEYLGRMDHQVKIRGFRVELGEIESALNQHPAIRESVVLANDGPGGAKRLVAYLVPSGTAPSVAEAREYLGQKVPDYMVPSIFMFMDTLPLTSNGKVDRRALPAPDSGQTATGQDCVPPRNPTETALVEIWCQLLDRKSVSIHENFFHLGGHSLLATQVISRIAGVLNVELPVRTIFEAPTVAGLAEAANRAKPGGSSSIARRVRGARDNTLLTRLGQLSDDELQALLQNPKLRDASS